MNARWEWPRFSTVDMHESALPALSNGGTAPPCSAAREEAQIPGSVLEVREGSPGLLPASDVVPPVFSAHWGHLGTQVAVTGGRRCDRSAGRSPPLLLTPAAHRTTSHVFSPKVEKSCSKLLRFFFFFLFFLSQILNLRAEHQKTQSSSQRRPSMLQT